MCFSKFIDTTAICINLFHFGREMLQTVFQFYCTRIFLEVYGVSQTWLNASQTVFIISNLILNPILGYLQDFGFNGYLRNRSKIIMIGGPISSLVFLMPWFRVYRIEDAPAWVVGIHLLVTLFLWNFLFVFNSLAFCAIYTEFSKDQKIRAHLFKYRFFSRLLASAVIFPVDKLSESLQNFEAFQAACVVLAIVNVVCGLATGIKVSTKTRGRLSKQELRVNSSSTDLSKALYSADSDREGDDSDSLLQNEHVVNKISSINTALLITKDVFSCIDWWCFSLGNFCGVLRTLIIASFLSIYTNILVPQNILTSGSTMMAAYYGVCTIASPIFCALVAPIAGEKGSYHVIQGPIIFTWINSLVGLTFGLFWDYSFVLPTLLIESILANINKFYGMALNEFIDEDTVKHKRKRPASALIVGLCEMLVRPAIGVAPMLVTHLLNLTGEFTENNQTKFNLTSDAMKLVTFLTAVLLPAVLGTIGFLAMVPYKIRGSKAVEIYLDAGNDLNEIKEDVHVNKVVTAST